MSKEKDAKEKDKEQIAKLRLQTESIYFKKSKDVVKTLTEILEKSTEIRDLYIPLLGCKVKIGTVNTEAFNEIMKLREDPNGMSLELLYQHMLSADPTVKREIVKNLPFNVVLAITNKITEEGLGFQIE